jgi:hypothetical protein
MLANPRVQVPERTSRCDDNSPQLGNHAQENLRTGKGRCRSREAAAFNKKRSRIFRGLKMEKAVQ